MAENSIRIDALMPAEMAERAETVGVKKAGLDFWTMFLLSVLAGAFIALGAVFSTTATAITPGGAALPFGVGKVLGGLVFSLGLILVVVAGAELFTGNNLIVMAWASGKVTTAKLLRNWVIVYIGNFIGSVITALLVLAARQYMAGGGAIGLNALSIANAKVQLGFGQAIALGILCNALVCLAVWLTFSARSTTDKILAIIPPISAFVAAGFEHSIANMYFIPMGLLIKSTAGPEFWASIGTTPADYPMLTWGNFFVRNLLPVTIGNIIGGALLVGAVYWFIYLRKVEKPAPISAPAGAHGDD
ncbi:MAG TPA: formate transporter FocA [Aggregatilineales bacterium]|nr:formate transporter FocA [Aggregatilineales bacterium]HPV06450.1 formate transporter FocA [Aggregatilineales bacterium]HQA68847.1 formate transporter FocA [Aggregatilineales bacterium]HQE19620.1 formate transporter FocA [Aggregatilineales bacterium]